MFCGFDEAHEKKLQSEINYKRGVKFFNQGWKEYLSPSKKRKYTLPVVVHIVHNGGSANISHAQVVDALKHLNDAFANRGYYNPQTGISIGIEFCLAKRNPQHTATTGITRTISSFTEINRDNEDQDLKDLVRWNPNNYINIWVVREICSRNGCGVAGYAYFPSAHGSPFDGIVVEAQFMGSSSAYSSVLIHEMGHYLGLYHTFQGGCPNDDCKGSGDRVCDTPPDQTTVRTSCEDAINSCKTDEDDSSMDNPYRSEADGGLGDQDDQFHNYMDYSRLQCYDRFTAGQAERMIYAIENQRSSLTRSIACKDPCPALVTAQILASRSSFLVGETVNLSGNVSHASSYEWTIDGTFFSSDQNISYNFTEEGRFEFIFQAFSNDSNCYPVSDTLLVDVSCPAEVNFSFTLNSIDIELTDLSSNNNRIEWKVSEQNGSVIASGIDSIFNYTFTGSGWFEICLSAFTDLCSSDSCFFVRIYPQGSEICDNGIDDDGDGWLDSFDEDCQEHDSLYMAQPEVECNAEMSSDSFSIRQKWRTSSQLTVMENTFPLIGDVDSDGSTEAIVVSFKGVDRGISIIDGKSGTLEKHIEIPLLHLYSHIAMADVNSDGEVEFFYFSRRRGFWYLNSCNLSGDLLWSTEVDLPSTYQWGFNSVNIADFNEDGIPEIYFAAQIFNAYNGKLLIKGLRGGGYGYFTNTDFTNLSIAGDFLPANPGLELAAGNTVYTINISNLNSENGNSMTPTSVLQNMPDGYTGMADFNGDAALEVLVIDNNHSMLQIYIWDPKSANVLATATFPRSIRQISSYPHITDINNDCKPEIIFNYDSEIIIFEYPTQNQTFTEYLRIPIDDQTGASSISSFDFNQDGFLELIIRDEKEIKIFEGISGKELASFPVNSWTGHEYPVVGDIDGDGNAEMLTTGVLNREYSLFAYEEEDMPWAPARSVWNQTAYHVTNINDDLTVPINQQNIANQRSDYCDCPAPYNTFLTQATYRTRQGCPINPAFDAHLKILNSTCSPDSITIEYQIQNLADQETLPDSLVIAVYDGNPLNSSATPILYDKVGKSIHAGESSSVLTLRIQNSAALNKIYLLANASSDSTVPLTLPVTGLYECDYLNNLDSISLHIKEITVDLGSDILLCDNQVIDLQAPTGYFSYLWNDGTSGPHYTAYEPGIHWVEVSNSCGQTVRDSVEIIVDPITQVKIISDSDYCEGDTIRLTVNEEFSEYQWFGLDERTCADCPEIKFLAEEDLNIFLRVGNDNGCYSTDSMRIEVRDSSLSKVEFKICPGDSLEIGGEWLVEPGTFTLNLKSDNLCDSTIVVQIDFKDTASTFELGNDTTLCGIDSLVLAVAGDYVIYIWQDSSSASSMTVDSSGIYWLEAFDQCNFVYRDSLNVQFSDTFLTRESYILCDGDTLNYAGDYLDEPGRYTYRLSSKMGCDSIVIIELNYDTLDYRYLYEIECEPPQIQLRFETNDSLAIYWPDSTSGLSRILDQGGSTSLRLQSLESLCDEKLILDLPSLPLADGIWTSIDTTVNAGNIREFDLGIDADEWNIKWSPSDAVSCSSCAIVQFQEDFHELLTVDLNHLESGCSYVFNVQFNYETPVYIPKAFSPNDDGINDLWKIYFQDGIERVKSVLVFNRWGNKVLHWSSNGPFSWDGMHNGQQLEVGVYAYYIELIDKKGAVVVKKGDVTLFR